MESLKTEDTWTIDKNNGTIPSSNFVFGNLSLVSRLSVNCGIFILFLTEVIGKSEKNLCGFELSNIFL